jgi:tRNA threonylcarbamoyladenosine modification (KEOPS) complex  Pcc1 subunit
MNYTATIDVTNPKLLELLVVEYKKVEKERFTITVDKNIKINAKDTTALKAALNSVANSMIIFEKMEKIK